MRRILCWSGCTFDYDRSRCGSCAFPAFVRRAGYESALYQSLPVVDHGSSIIPVVVGHENFGVHIIHWGHLLPPR